jgi:hypothetical protein
MGNNKRQGRNAGVLRYAQNDNVLVAPKWLLNDQCFRAVLLMLCSLKRRFPAGMTTRKTKVLHTFTESALLIP